MKKIIIVALIGFASISLSSNVNAKDIGQSVCDITASDEKSNLRTFIKANNLKIRKIYKLLKCNDMGILEFAASEGSLEIGAYYIAKIPRSQLREVIGKIEVLSPDLYEIALKRVKG
jgi:hypothetical protein